jgi:exonuclease SbcC
MIRRIILENYMSHAHTPIELATGLTVLVGPNNCGKSAVVSALETLCNNASGGYMVRHDEKEASVTVETDDGHTFVWKRRGNAVSYIIDGREISRLKRSVPDDLHKLLRLPKVDGGETGEPFDIHFGTQKSPIFLLNEPESRAALFFASSSDAAILLEMQKRHRNKVKDRKSDEKRLRGEIEKLDAELDALKPLDALGASVAQANDQYQELQELEGQIQTLGKEIEAIRAHSVKHARLLQEHQCLAPLKAPPALDDVQTLEPLCRALSREEENHRKLEAKAVCLGLLKEPPVLDDTCSLKRLVDDLESAQLAHAALRCQQRVLEGLTPPPQLADLEPLAMLISQLEAACRAVAGHEASIKATLLKEPPVLDDTCSLKRLVDDLESAQLARAALCHQQRVLESLTSPPEVVDPEPLAMLISQLEGAFRAVAGHEASITTTAADMAKAHADMHAAERVGARPVLPGSATRRSPRHILLALGGFAGIAAVILLFIFGAGWASRLNSGSSNRAYNEVDPKAAAVAKAGGIEKTGKASESQKAPEKETPKRSPEDEPRKDEPEKQEPKKENHKEEPRKVEPNKPEPKKEEARVAKPLRLKQVRQLLNDAEMASEKGKYLEAVLGFGQAAILYPQELADVENPEKVRRKFIDALKRYQAEVEWALKKAAEQKPGDR